MKIALAVLLSLTLAAGSIAAEVQVLPAQTAISMPGKPVAVLDEPHFLLDREDMEKATLAMETVPIRDEQIAALTDSYTARVKLDTQVTVGATIVGFIVGLLFGVIFVK